MTKNALAMNGMVGRLVTVSLAILMCLSVLPLMSLETGAVAIPATISTPMKITTDTTWDSGTCAISANLTVQSPAKLTISNVTINFVNNWTSHSNGGGGGNKTFVKILTYADFAKYFGIKVEKGAKLIIYDSTLQGKTKNDIYNIVIDGGTLDIRRDTFKNLDYDGIVVDGDNGVGPIIKDNKFDTVSDGLSIFNTTTSVINNTFSNVNNNGLYFYSTTMTARLNTFSGTSNGIRGEQSTCTITKNTVGVSSNGIYISTGTCSINNNTVKGDQFGYAGIEVDSASGDYNILDNEVYSMNYGIESYSTALITKNNIHDCDQGIMNYNMGGNKTMKLAASTITWNTLNTIRYTGIEIYGGNNLEVSNNTITTIGTQWDTGIGIAVGMASGNTVDNNITDVQGYGFNLRQGASMMTFRNNGINDVRAGNQGNEYTGGINLETYSQDQFDFYPSMFQMSKVDIPFRFSNSGTVNVWGFDLTPQDLGKTMDVLVVSDFINTDAFLYNTNFNNYKLEPSQWGGSGTSSITISWSTNFHGFWEGTGDPVVMGGLTVNDTFGQPAFQGNTDSNGYLGPFYLSQLYEAKGTSAGNGTGSQKKVFSPYLFHFEGSEKGNNYMNETNVTVTGVSFTTMTLDDVAPFITITSPTEGTLTNKTTIEVSGSTELRSHVTINKVVADVTPDGNFTAVVPLTTEGKNTLSVVSIDKGKNKSTRVVNVTRDTTLPELTMTYPDQDAIYNKMTLNVKGTTEPGAFLTVNGKNVTIAQDGSWNITLAFTAEGTNSVTVISKDAAGNTATITHTFTLDITPPTLFVFKPLNNSVTKNPTQDVSGSVEKDCSLTVNGRKTLYDGSTYTTTVELVEGINPILVTATDHAGNSKTVKVFVNRDSKPPSLAIISPPDNLRTSKFSITVNGTTDKDATVAINGIVEQNVNGTFSDSVFLNDGSNRITVDATDPAGNTVTKVRKVFKEAGGTGDPVTVTSPQNGTVVSGTSVTLVGSLNELGALTLNGQPVSVDKNDNFVYTVPLKEGKNVITLTLKDVLGNNFTLSWTVFRDTTAPNIDVLSPKGTVDQANVLIKGKTEANATVTVNGLMVYVSANGEFTAPVTLNSGKNTVYITAVDKVGNSKTLPYSINYQPAGSVSGLGAGSAITIGLIALLIVLVIIIMVLMFMMMNRMGGTKPAKEIVEDEPEEEQKLPEKEAPKAAAPKKELTLVPPPLPPKKSTDVKVEPMNPSVKMKKE